jgi:hypothetical protein
MKNVTSCRAEAASDDLDTDSDGERLASNLHGGQKVASHLHGGQKVASDLHGGQKVASVLQEDALDGQTDSGALAFAAAMTEEDPNGNAELCSSATADFR